MKADFLAFKQFYREAIGQVSDKSFFYQSIVHKFKHSVAVLHFGERILSETPELSNKSDDFRQAAQKALLFHDIGRFDEAVWRYRQQNLTLQDALEKSDHGLIGYNKLQNHPLYNDQRILFAIRYHGKMIEEVWISDMWQNIKKQPISSDAKEILFLVRDADKLANLDIIKKENHLQKDLFFQLLTSETLNAGLSDNVIDQFFARKTIVFNTVYSFADRILMVLSWIFDLNYQTTKDIFKHHKYDEYLLDLLSQYQTMPETLSRIRKIVQKTL